MVDDDYLEHEFRRAKKKALKFIEQFNSKLPTERCPNCRSPGGHVPGIACPEPGCGYIHNISYVLLLDSEWGYDIVSLNNRKHRVTSFNIDEDAAENAIDDDDTEGDGAS